MKKPKHKKDCKCAECVERAVKRAYDKARYQERKAAMVQIEPEHQDAAQLEAITDTNTTVEHDTSFEPINSPQEPKKHVPVLIKAADGFVKAAIVFGGGFINSKYRRLNAAGAEVLDTTGDEVEQFRSDVESFMQWIISTHPAHALSFLLPGVYLNKLFHLKPEYFHNEKMEMK